ncbi:hypothetical protein [Algicola sagamiensis]|uniref:hypothetical protein n=1 Tax=Algicola sagamiensis TaxID=163869 RepID=UPI0003610F22|nr:hypothetical protein [Algicola sagamiensis]
MTYFSKLGVVHYQQIGLQEEAKLPSHLQWIKDLETCLIHQRQAETVHFELIANEIHFKGRDSKLTCYLQQGQLKLEDKKRLWGWLSAQ